MPPGRYEGHESRLAVHLAAGVFFFAVAVWLSWPLATRLGDGLSDSPDSLLNHWVLAWNFHILPRAPLSLFDANIFFPRHDTLAYSEHLFGVAVVAAPAYWLTGNTVFAYNFAVLASFVLSGLGMYLLVWELTACRWGALFAGIVYMAAPYRFLHILHIQLLSAQWFPFVLLYLYRYLRHGRRRQMAAASGFALLQVLSCNYYAMYLALALLLFGASAAAFSWRTPRVLSLSKTAWLLAGAVFVALLAMPFAAAYERNREEGFYRRYEDVVQFSAEPRDYLRPSSFNKAPTAAALPRQARSEKALFPGAAVLVLAAFGLMARRGARDPFQRLMWFFFATLLPIAFVLSLGPRMEIYGQVYALPYHALYRYVPGFGGMRVPARLAILVLLALGPLAGWGARWVCGKAGRLEPWAGTAVIALALFEYQTTSLERVLPPVPETPPIYTWLAGQDGDFGVLELPMHQQITKESLRMHHSTAHWKRLANGFSGWWPNDYWILVGRMQYFPTTGTVRFLLRDVPVRFVLIHYGQYAQRDAERLRQNMERYSERIPARARLGSDVVYELLPQPAPEGNRGQP